MPDMISCPCGKTHAANQIANHTRSRQHQEYVAAHPPAAAAPAPVEPVALGVIEPGAEDAGADDYAAQLSAALNTADPDIDARELSPAEAKLRREARERGEPVDVAVGAADHPLDGKAGIRDAEIDLRGNNGPIKEAPPPWAEGRAPSGFREDGRTSADASAAARAKDPDAPAWAVDVDTTPEGRAARAQRSREMAAEQAPTVLEQMLGANPGMTRRNHVFVNNELTTDPDGARWRFTRYHADVFVLEDRFELVTEAHQRQIAGKVAALEAYNATVAPNERIGYLPLLASVVRPSIEIVERALGRECIAGMIGPEHAGGILGTSRLQAGRIVDVSVPLGEMQEDFARAST